MAAMKFKFVLLGSILWIQRLEIFKIAKLNQKLNFKINSLPPPPCQFNILYILLIAMRLYIVQEKNEGLGQTKGCQGYLVFYVVAYI